MIVSVLKSVSKMSANGGQDQSLDGGKMDNGLQHEEEEREPPTPPDTGSDYNPDPQHDSGSESEDDERASTSQRKRAKRNGKAPRKRIRRPQGQMLQTRRPYTEERRQKTYTKLEANAQVARENLMVDTEELPLPDRTKVRDVLYDPSKQAFYFDSMASTFFTCGAFLYKELKAQDELQGFEIRYFRNRKPKRGYIHALCGHLVLTPDAHKLCRNCHYIATNLLCYKKEECDICAQQPDTENAQRRGRNGRPNTAMAIKTVGGRYEARHLLSRWYYLEGVLWCLASIYEKRLNIEALKKCRRNIFFLTRVLPPRGFSKPVTPLPGDCDLPDDSKHSALEAISAVQMVRRSSRTQRMVPETDRAALARLEQASQHAPATTQESQPVPSDALNALSTKLRLNNQKLEERYPEMAEMRRNGYSAMRFENKLRTFSIRVNPLSSVEQRRRKLEDLGYNPDRPFEPHKPKAGAKLTSTQRAARQRNPARKFEPNDTPQVELATAEQCTNAYMYPLPVDRNDITPSEAEQFMSASEADAEQGSTRGRGATRRQPHGGSTSDESGDEPMEDDDAADVFMSPPIVPAARDSTDVATDLPPPASSAAASQASARKRNSPPLRRSSRLAAKRVKVEQAQERSKPKPLKPVKRKDKIRKSVKFKVKTWIKFKYLKYRIRLALNRVKRPRGEKPKYRYQFRKAPPAPFLLYKAELIFQHICRERERLKAAENDLRRQKGTTVLTWPQHNELQTIARIRASYEYFAEKRAAAERAALASLPPIDDSGNIQDSSVQGTLELTTEQQKEAGLLDGSSSLPLGCDAFQLAERSAARKALEKSTSQPHETASAVVDQPPATGSGGIKKNPTASLPAGGQSSAGAPRRQVGRRTKITAKRKRSLSRSPQRHDAPAGQPGNGEAQAAAKKPLFDSTESSEIPTPTDFISQQPASTPAELLAAVTENIELEEAERAAQAAPAGAEPKQPPLENGALAPQTDHTYVAAEPGKTSEGERATDLANGDHAPGEVAASEQPPDPYAGMPSLEEPLPPAAPAELPAASPPGVKPNELPAESPPKVKQDDMSPHEAESTAAGDGAMDGQENEHEQPAESAPNTAAEATTVNDEPNHDMSPSEPALQGQLSAKNWAKILRDFNLKPRPDSTWVETIVELLYQAVGTLAQREMQMRRIPVRAINKVCDVNSGKLDAGDLTHTELYQIARALNKLLQEHPELLELVPNPWEDLSKIYEMGRRDVEKELAETAELIEGALAQTPNEDEEEATGLAYGVTQKLYRRITELIEELQVTRDARANMAAETQKVKERSDTLEGESYELYKENKQLKESEASLKARLIEQNTRIDEAHSKAATSDQLCKTALENHTKQLETQRVAFEKSLKESRDENIKLRDSLRVATSAAVEAKRKLEEAEKRHREDLEERPATDRHVRLMQEKLKEAYRTRRETRKTLLDTEVELAATTDKLAKMTALCKDGGRFIHQAAKNVFSPSSAGPPSTIVSTTASSSGQSHNTGTPFNESIARLRAEARHVSGIIPDDLIDVEPMTLTTTKQTIPFWDFYVF